MTMFIASIISNEFLFAIIQKAISVEVSSAR
jgi:hypothetical protein